MFKAGKPFYISGGVFEIALKTGEFIDCEISDVTNALMDDVSGFLLKESSDSSLTFDVLKGINELCYTIDPLLTSKSKFHRIIDEVYIVFIIFLVQCIFLSVSLNTKQLTKCSSHFSIIQIVLPMSYNTKLNQFS